MQIFGSKKNIFQRALIMQSSQNGEKMFLYLGGLIIGFIVLMWSADKFVDGASSLATSMGMSRLLVGMIIVGFGTSAPEMTVSALASYEGNAGIALGNVYGSNIANIALILGLTVLIRPIAIEKKVVFREIPLLMGATILSIALLWDLHISRLDALILLVAFAIVMFLSIRDSMREKKLLNDLSPVLGENSPLQVEEEEIAPMPMKMAIFWLVAGLVLLVGSSRLLVWASVNIATAFGVSEIIIGLTIVAIGTSLPELAASIAASRKNEHSLVIGNIVGSNFFNTLMCVGVAGLVRPIEVLPEVLNRDLLLVIGLTALLFIFCIKVGKQKDGILSRYEGFVLLMVYTLYTAYLISIALGQPITLKAL